MQSNQFKASHKLMYYLLVIGLLLQLVFSAAIAQVTNYSEAPALAARVAAGELPPVEERLPENPVVVPVVDRIGQYGGDWNMGILGAGDTHLLMRTLGYEGLLRWDPEWSEIIPNIAESYEVREDGREFIFHLRQGLKWSDGHPFTADDIVFWYEDVVLNNELSPAGPTAVFVRSGEAGVVRKIDDYTVSFTFVEPHGLFPSFMAQEHGRIPIRYPRHYLEQLHPKYNPEGIDALVSEAGVNNWTDLWFPADHPGRQDPNLPTLYPWVVTVPVGESTRVIAERNPYYFKVDPEGNQLPYLDRVVYEVVSDVEVLLLKAMSGEIDMQDRNINVTQNRAVLFDNMERGNYRFYEAVPTDMNTAMIALNLTHDDPVKREVFNNKDFRIGLSHAINRQEIIDLLYVSQGEPWQSSPRPGTPFYNERLAKQYTEYDLELANEHLDRVLPEKDSAGFRLGPNGQRFTFFLEVTDAHGLSWPDVAELVQGYWRAVGIDMQYRVIDRSLFEERRTAATYDAMIWRGFGGGTNAITDPRWYFPAMRDGSDFGPLWAFWYTDPSDPRGEEPPEEVRRQAELYDQILATADLDEQIRLMNELLEISADLFHVMGISLREVGFGIVKNNFHNVPESMPNAASDYPNPGPTNPAQYFKTNE